jgi:hypothetical protein
MWFCECTVLQKNNFRDCSVTVNYSEQAQAVQHNKSGIAALEKYMHRTRVVASRDNVAVNK